MVRRNTRQNSQRDSRNSSTRSYNNNRYDRNRRNSNSEYSRNSYQQKRREDTNSEENKKFENPKFFYKRVYGNYSKLYVPEAYESKRNEKKTSVKSETEAQLEFQDVISNDENLNDTNLLNKSSIKKNSKTDLKSNESTVTANKKDKLKIIYTQIKKLEKELDVDVPLENLNEYNFNILKKEHLQLISKYIELVKGSYKIAITRYEIDTKIWKLGIYKLFNLYRNYLNDLYTYQGDEFLEEIEKIKESFGYFIKESLKNIYQLAQLLKEYDTNSDVPLHKSVKFNRYQVAWHRSMFYINDLFRYQYLHGLVPSEFLEDLWLKANFINKRVIQISPNNGLLYHQMAILHLSKDNKIEALYYFLRSLCVRNPYTNSRETHLSFFDNVFQEFDKVCNEYSSIYNFETFSLQYAHLHGILYTKIGTEKFNSVLKRFMKAIKIQSENLKPLMIRTMALCNIAILHHYINIKNDNLLELPIQLLIEQLETNIRVFLNKQDKKFLHYIEVIMYWLIVSLHNNESYLDLMKDKLKNIWPLFVKISNIIEQSLYDQNINIDVIEEDLNDNQEDNEKEGNAIENNEEGSEEENKNKNWNNLKSMKFIITRSTESQDSADNEEEENENENQLTETFTFKKSYDLEYRGFVPLQNLFEFIEYDDSISNYEDWYKAIMSKCGINNKESTSDNNNLLNVQTNGFNNMNDNDVVEEERIIILMNIIKKYIKEIDYDGCYWNYKNECAINGSKNYGDYYQTDYSNIDFNEMSDHETSPTDQVDIFDSIDQNIYNNDGGDIDELKKTKQMLSEFLADSYEKENHDEIIINPQLTKIIFDTNCFINSLNSIKNIFENTNLNIIIPLAVITELSGLQNCKKQAKDALDYLKYIIGQTNHRALLKVVTTKGNTLYNIDNIYHENWHNIGKDFMNADDAILSCFNSVSSSSYNQNHFTNNLNYTKNIIVSNDKNMRVKARAQNIVAFNNNEFIGMLRRKNILS